MSITKIYLLENLCCENCAAAIERETASLPGVTAAKIDYEATKLTVTFDGDEQEMLHSVSSIASEIDEDIVTREM
ncbi:MAG: heavy-metal-associated domain-containing protein [Clostridiales bacterium]|jgi:Cd2+/Zn2+-exporting ATPase|nr:heavy-metal-associated domain-containing protein [Clostridiales bacterium]